MGFYRGWSSFVMPVTVPTLTLTPTPTSTLTPTLPHDASLNGHHVDALLGYLTISTGIVFAVMATVLVVAVIFHRGPRRQARYTHGNSPRARAITTAAALVVLFGIDAVAVVRTSDQLRAVFWRYPDRDPRALRVEVTAQQWAWTFRYPGADARFNTADDIVTLNELRVPVDRAVYLQLTSKDVVHSFYLPNFRNKIDAIPGAVTRLWFQPRERGVFEIACAQHCGAWHYKMRGELAVLTEDDFARWSARAAADVVLRGGAGGDSTGSGSGRGAAGPATGSPSGEATAAGAEATTPSDGWDWVPPRG
jgi:cytochrome c oxidase subunit 2